jgi:hypothetical protein
MWSIPRDWPGSTIFIFGGGPSLRGFDPERLRGQRTIVINRMVLPVDENRRTPADPQFDGSKLNWPGVPWADILYFADYAWWRADKQAVAKVWEGGRIITSNRQVASDVDAGFGEVQVFGIQNTGTGGLERKPTGVRNGSNSGHQAMNVAYHLGAARIVLLGFDQRVDGLTTHAHGGYRGGAVAADQYAEKLAHQMTVSHLPYFQRIGLALAREGVEVLNASPESAIACFPKITLDEAVALVKTTGAARGTAP